MNQAVAESQTELSPVALAVMNPDKYVATVYQTFGTQLKAATEQHAATDYDVNTTAGLDMAKRRRAVFRTLRTDVEKARKERKAPILEIGKLLDSKAKELTAKIEPLEAAHDALIKAEETRKAEEKAERERIEAERIAALRKRVDDIRAIAARSTAKDSAEIAAEIDTLDQLLVTADEFGELAGEAMMAQTDTLATLRDLEQAAKAREAEAARLAAERLELERLRAEAAERERQDAQRRAEEEAKAKAAREAEEARLQAERDAHAAEMRRQTEAFEARQREAAEAAQRAREAEEKRMAEARADIERQRQELAALQPAPEVDDLLPCDEMESDKATEPVAKPTRPTDEHIIEVIALHFRVHESKVIEWLLDMDFESAGARMAEEFA